MPDVEPVVFIEGTQADPDPTDASHGADVVEQTERETGPADTIEAEASPDTPPEHEPAAIEGSSLPRVPGPHDRVRKIAAIAFIAAVLLGAAAVTLTRSPYFAAHRIEVRGTSHVTRSEVLRIAGITPGTNVFTLDAGSAEARLERDPWIAQATVMKDLPSTLVIDVDERVAVAVVETGGALRLVADDGALLEAALPRTAAGLPTIASTEPGVQPGPDAIGGAGTGDRRHGSEPARSHPRRVDPVRRAAPRRPLVRCGSCLRRGGRAVGESDGVAGAARLRGRRRARP